MKSTKHEVDVKKLQSEGTPEDNLEKHKRNKFATEQRFAEMASKVVRFCTGLATVSFIPAERLFPL